MFHTYCSSSTAKHPVPTKIRPKRGARIGKPINAKMTMKDWYRVCEMYENLKVKMSQSQFLRSSKSGASLTGTQSERVSFSNMLKKYRSGTLKNIEKKRIRDRKFVDIEEKLIEYLHLRETKFKQDKLGTSWTFLTEKCKEWAKDMNVDDFKFFAGWLNNTLKAHNMDRVKLHGEADDLNDEEVATLMIPFRQQLEDLIEKKDIEPHCLYNADQTGMFYQKLPNSIYVQKKNKKNFKGTKQMTDKTRVTLMICTAADGFKVPIALIGKSKKPTCFELIQPGKRTPLPYKHQKNAWFDKQITIWWIDNVFWPEHLKRNGDVNAILILDNCSAHKFDMSMIPVKLTILFLPPNVTNRHQPADMGMIAGLKAGYKSLYLHTLLGIFDTPGGYEKAAERRMKQRRGQRGIQHGGKPHILDCMEMLKQIWDGDDGKYVSIDSIKRCWRKANILPITWNQDIHNDVGRSSVPFKDKVVSKEISDELCDLMNSIQLKADEYCVDTESNAGHVFKDTFVTDGESISQNDMECMVEVWINIEDDEDIVNELVEEAIHKLDIAETTSPDDDIGDDDEEMTVENINTPTTRYTHQDAVQAFDILQSFMQQNKNPQEHKLALERLRHPVQKHHMQKPKKSPTITSYFQQRR